VHLELPETEPEYGGHGSHCAAPATDENVFCGHSVHGEKNISGLLNLPGAHLVHCVAPLACNI
jgi:hypothetical protein